MRLSSRSNTRGSIFFFIQMKTSCRCQELFFLKTYWGSKRNISRAQEMSIITSATMSRACLLGSVSSAASTKLCLIRITPFGTEFDLGRVSSPGLTMAVIAHTRGWIADTLVSKGLSITSVRKITIQLGSQWRAGPHNAIVSILCLFILSFSFGFVEIWMALTMTSIVFDGLLKERDIAIIWTHSSHLGFHPLLIPTIIEIPIKLSLHPSIFHTHLHAHYPSH